MDQERLNLHTWKIYRLYVAAVRHGLQTGRSPNPCSKKRPKGGVKRAELLSHYVCGVNDKMLQL